VVEEIDPPPIIDNRSNKNDGENRITNVFVCAAGNLCQVKGYPQDADCLVCLNCNRLAHESCVEPLLVNSSHLVPFSLSVHDLDQDARRRFDLMVSDEKNKVAICLLCDKRLKVLKVHGTNIAPSMAGVPPPRQRKKFPRILVRQLQRLAAFQCQVYIFTRVEKIGKDDRENRV